MTQDLLPSETRVLASLREHPNQTLQALASAIVYPVSPHFKCQIRYLLQIGFIAEGANGTYRIAATGVIRANGATL
jgi:hypothetical protein